MQSTCVIPEGGNADTVCNVGCCSADSLLFGASPVEEPCDLVKV